MLKCDFRFSYAEFDLHADFEMHQQLLGIVGASGSGKSTFLKNIVGLLEPSEGTIYFQNKTLFDRKQNINIAMHQRHIALIFQNALLFPHMNVLQNLQYAEKLVTSQIRKFKFADIIDVLELQPLIKRKAHQLSGGEAQRVSIGRALLSSPNLLLLDEPLTGLDHRLKQQILPFLKAVKTEFCLPMIYVTHQIEEVTFLDAEIVNFENGKMTKIE